MYPLEWIIDVVHPEFTQDCQSGDEMPGEAHQQTMDEEDHSSNPDLTGQQRLASALEIATEMSIAYRDSLERDAGIEFRSPRLQSITPRSA
jgi:hypothetical protein